MKATRIVRAISVAAAGALAFTGATALGLPANAVRTTVVVVESNALTSFNSGTPDTNLTVNTDVGYLTGMGFNYYDNNRNLIKNTTFGTYTQVAKTGCAQAVKYTVKPGRVWSDGTPITGVDLLLSHVLNSGAYSKAAGLGDPADPDVTPKFFSGGYGGPYDSHVKGLPTLSSDKMSVTICYDAYQPDWEIMGPGPAPVHALVEMANGDTSIQAAADRLADKALFLSYFTSKNTAKLTAIGNVWSNDYNITSVNSSTNPLLFISNGGYIVDAAVTNQSVTLVKNPKYNSGPATSGITTVVFKFISDGTAASQALANHEIDVYQGQPTADAVASLKAMSGVTTVGGVSACFEHLDLRVGTATGQTKYTGPFAASTNATKDRKARDLRTAFLLAYPRQQIVDNLVKPINPRAVVVNSSFLLPGQAGYSTIVAKSGVSKFTAGTQVSRTAAALALVKKWYPTASATNSVVPVKMLWGALSNTRRANEFALAVRAVKKAGFALTNPSYDGGWSGHLDDSTYDAQFFAWCPSSNAVTGTNANFQSDGSNNHLGYDNAAMDAVLKKLESKQTAAGITALYLAADKLLVQDALTLPIFQHPAVTAYTSTLKNVKPSPLVPNLVWNYWQWHF